MIGRRRASIRWAKEHAIQFGSPADLLPATAYRSMRLALGTVDRALRGLFGAAAVSA